MEDAAEGETEWQWERGSGRGAVGGAEVNAVMAWRIVTVVVVTVVTVRIIVMHLEFANNLFK